MENRRFYLRHPLLAAILLPLLGGIWVSIPDIFPVVCGLANDRKTMLIVYLLSAVFALMLLLMHKHHYRPGYRGSFRKEGLSDKKAWICIAVFLTADLAVYLFKGFKNGFYPFDITYICPAINAGVCEETVSRVLPLSVIMFGCRKKKSLWSALILTSVLFGMLHMVNIRAGAAADITLLQVIAAGISGMFLGALYLRTGNVFLSMLLHTVHDFIAFLGIGGYAAMTMAVTAGVVAEEVILAAVEIICIFVLMKDQEKIHIPVWKERWSCTEENNSSLIFQGEKI